MPLDVWCLILYTEVMNEIWKPITGLSKYEVSNLGRVRHIKHKKIRKWSNHKGYCRYIVLDDSGKPFTISGHRAVYFAFNPDADTKLHVDHINHVRDDNRLVNLRGVTVLRNNANIRRGHARVSLATIERVLSLAHLPAEEIYKELKKTQ